MATPISQPRLSARRRATIEEALDHAQAITAEQGAGAVTVSEIARRLGMRAPSLYKYFPSLHAIYDALFARGNARMTAYLEEQLRGVEPGLASLREGVRAMVRWSTAESGLAPLLFWRPVPGFEPSPESFAPAVEHVGRVRAHLAAAVATGELSPAADSEEAVRMLSLLVAGICSQQMANGPGESFEDGAFTSMTDQVFQMFVDHYR